MASNDWRETTLGDLIGLQRGHDLTASERRPGIIPVMGSAGISGYHDTALAKGPGVTIGRSGVGSMGVVSYCPVDYWPHNTVLYVTDFHHNDERFTYYFLRYLDLRRFDSGSAQASLNRNYIYPLRVRVPQLREQRAIAHILGTLDDKIEMNRRMNETLEAMAWAIFKSWFVDFDPVRAKAEGRDTGLSKSIADIFPDTFEDSELGEIPKGWRIGPLTEIATLQATTVHPAERPETLWEHYSIPAFDEGRQPKWERGETIKSGKFAVPKNCVLASKLNPQFPRVWLPDVRDRSVAVCSTEFMPFVPVAATWRPFLFQLANSEPFQGEILSRVTGSTGSRQRVQPQQIASVPVVVPPQEVIQAFSTAVGPLQERQSASIREASSSNPIASWNAVFPLHSGPVNRSVGCGASGHSTRSWTQHRSFIRPSSAKSSNPAPMRSNS